MTVSIAIMQPYFLPYIGYWQLVKEVDIFVVYDNIKFTKQSWIRRNRLFLNGKDDLFTLPIKKDSDFLNVNERYLVDNYHREAKKMLNKIRTLYRSAPNFSKAMPVIEHCFMYENHNLFDFIFHSIHTILEYLRIDTTIIKSSDIEIDHSLTSQDRIFAICNKLSQQKYINPIGGVELYCKNNFMELGIDLQFHKTNDFKYNQFNYDFIPHLSILDVMMFNSYDEIQLLLEKYRLI